ncbi:MBL fold metallo-hydrolase [Camelliibacillus cellulosilyticus]|uniref:MBL fold metallo-hydrolase n=1 Tax=Camelliibacillus cellulosilyticus TaxID=2174486 RepID=A0ABV9GLF2_9BACL
MKWTGLALGAIQTNAYILENEKKEAVIFDPGADFQTIKNYIENNRLHPLAVLLTHAHFDHIGALDAVRAEWHIPAYLHKNEADWPQDPMKNGSAYFPIVEDMVVRPADVLLNGEEQLEIGPFAFQVLETPGHSPGSISYYLSDEHVIFSGDAVFYGSIGRTDLYGGDQDQLLKSIHTKILPLPEETIILPGHGFKTTVAREKHTNPFLV